MKILVCGSRDFSYSDDIVSFLDYFPKCKCTTVITGYARGADKLASECAKMMGMTVHDYPANWIVCNYAAGILRNQKMLDSEHVASCPINVCAYFVYPKKLEESKGTFDMVTRCQNAGDIEIVDFMNVMPSELREIIRKINDKTNIVCNV
jgi:hypothetical protein